MKRFIALLLVFLLTFWNSVPIMAEPTEATVYDDGSLSDKDKQDAKDLLNGDNDESHDEYGDFIWNDDNKEFTIMSWDNTDWKDYQNRLNPTFEISGRAQVTVDRDLAELFLPRIKSEILNRETKFLAGDSSDTYSRDSYALLVLAMIEILAEDCGIVNPQDAGDLTAAEIDAASEDLTDEDDSMTVSSETLRDIENMPFKTEEEIKKSNPKLVEWAYEFGQLFNPNWPTNSINSNVDALFDSYCRSVETWCDHKRESIKTEDEVAEPYPNRVDKELFSVVQGTIMQYSQSSSHEHVEYKSYSSDYMEYETKNAVKWYSDNKAKLTSHYAKSAYGAQAIQQKYDYDPDPEFAYKVSQIYSAFAGINTGGDLQKYLDGVQFPPGAPVDKIAEFLGYANEKLNSKTKYQSPPSQRYPGTQDPWIFDCSSFTQYCMYKVGVKNPPSYTGAYPGGLQEIPKEEALPGDILIKTQAPRHAMICLQCRPGQGFTIVHCTTSKGKSGVQITENRSWGRVQKVYRWWGKVQGGSGGGGTYSSISSPTAMNFLTRLAKYNVYIKSHKKNFECNYSTRTNTYSDALMAVTDGRNVGITSVVPIHWALVDLGVKKSTDVPLQGKKEGLKKQYRGRIKGAFKLIRGKKPCGISVASAVSQGLLCRGDIILFKGYRRLVVYSGSGTRFYDAGEEALVGGKYSNGIVVNYNGKVIHEVLRWRR